MSGSLFGITLCTWPEYAVMCPVYMFNNQALELPYNLSPCSCPHYLHISIYFSHVSEPTAHISDHNLLATRSLDSNVINLSHLHYTNNCTDLETCENNDTTCLSNFSDKFAVLRGFYVAYPETIFCEFYLRITENSSTE